MGNREPCGFWFLVWDFSGLKLCKYASSCKLFSNKLPPTWRKQMSLNFLDKIFSSPFSLRLLSSWPSSNFTFRTFYVRTMQSCWIYKKFRSPFKEFAADFMNEFRESSWLVRSVDDVIHPRHQRELHPWRNVRFWWWHKIQWCHKKLRRNGKVEHQKSFSANHNQEFTRLSVLRKINFYQRQSSCQSLTLSTVTWFLSLQLLRKFVATRLPSI